MNISDNLRKIYNDSLKNDQKIDQKEFAEIKKEIIKDNVTDQQEKLFLTEMISKKQLTKEVVPLVTDLFSEQYQEKDSTLKTLAEMAERNDQVIDTKEFALIKKEILSDNKLTKEDVDFLYGKLAEGKFASGTVPAVFEFISENTTAEKQETVTIQNNQTTEKHDGLTIQSTPTEKPVKAEETKKEELPKADTKKEEPKKEAPKAEEKKDEKAKDEGWTHKAGLRGNFNLTSVSEGWSQYGKEQSATRVEGAMDGELNYKTGKHKWSNKFLVEYGNIWLKGGERAISKDNSELTTEYSYTAIKNGNFSIEVPFLKLFTRGPMSELGDRRIRESTGAKMVYENKETQSKYSLSLGGGLQQTHDKVKDEWLNEPGTEVIVEVSQNLNVMQKTMAVVFDKKPEDFNLLDRVEVTGSANTFLPLRSGFSWSNADVTMRSGAKIYLNEGKNLWFGVNKEWRYGGKEGSTWENRTTLDLGLKF